MQPVRRDRVISYTEDLYVPECPVCSGEVQLDASRATVRCDSCGTFVFSTISLMQDEFVLLRLWRRYVTEVRGDLEGLDWIRAKLADCERAENDPSKEAIAKLLDRWKYAILSRVSNEGSEGNYAAILQAKTSA